DLGPGDLAAADGEEAFAQVADVHARLAVPDEVQPADEQPQHVHGVLPARRAALAQVVPVLAELRLAATEERAVRVPGAEGRADGQQFLPGRRDLLHER